MYSNHYKYVSEIINQGLEKANLDGVLIYSGHTKNYFLDDMPYAFASNPHFRWMVPITETTTTKKPDLSKANIKKAIAQGFLISCNPLIW